MIFHLSCPKFFPKVSKVYTYLHHYAKLLHCNWSEYLPLFECAINSRWYSALNTMPFYAAPGYQPQTFPYCNLPPMQQIMCLAGL